MTALDDFLAGEFDLPDDDEGRARFVVDGPEKADWALGKLAEVQHLIAGNEALADHKRQLVVEWLDVACRPLKRDEQFFTGLLMAWWRDELAKMLADAGGDWAKVRRKSRTLPSGSVGGRYSTPVPVYDDEEAAAAWLKANRPELVATVDRPKRDDVKKAIDAGLLKVADGVLVDPETGEPVPGVSVPEVADVLDALTIQVKANRP